METEVHRHDEIDRDGRRSALMTSTATWTLHRYDTDRNGGCCTSSHRHHWLSEEVTSAARAPFEQSGFEWRDGSDQIIVDAIEVQKYCAWHQIMELFTVLEDQHVIDFIKEQYNFSIEQDHIGTSFAVNLDTMTRDEIQSDDVSEVNCPQGSGIGSEMKKPLCHAISEAHGKFMFKLLPCDNSNRDKRLL